MVASHRAETERRIGKVRELLSTGSNRVRIERPSYMIVRYFLDGEYIVTRSIYQLVCEHELPEWRAN